jgi:transposase-like protein
MPKPPTTPEFRTKIVKGYVSRPPNVSGKQYADSVKLPLQHIQNWTWEARKAGEIPPADNSPRKAARPGGQASAVDPEVKAKVIAEAIEGKLTREQIAAKHGVTKKDVSDWKYKSLHGLTMKVVKSVKPAGEEDRVPGGVFSDDFKRRAVEAYKNRKPGQSARVVAAELGMKSEAALYVWLKHPRFASSDAAPEVDPRQQVLFDVPRMIEQMDPTVATTAHDRVSGQLARAREEIAKLTEDNAILRGIASLAVRRGLLDLFGINEGGKRT